MLLPRRSRPPRRALRLSTLLLAALAGLAGCGTTSASSAGGAGGSGVGARGDGGDDVGGSGGAGGSSAPDPCTGAWLGDGTYCGDSLEPPGDPAILYACAGGATEASETCMHGCSVAPPGTPDACAPNPADVPRGKGAWIWIFGSSAPPAAEAAALAEQMGIGYVLIKSGEDDAVYTSNFNAAIVSEFTSRGIWVFAWNYVRPGDVLAKASILAEQANIPGVRGMVLDVESEWEDSGSQGDAVALCDAIRAQTPGKMLGFSSFGWITYHLGLPWAEFDAHCGDMHLPQTYWDAWTTGRLGGYEKAVEGKELLGLQAPIWAAQDNYEGSPTVEELNSFFAAAGPYASLWRWPNPEDGALLEQMKALDWAN